MRIVNDRHEGEDPFGEREPVLTIIPERYRTSRTRKTS